MIKFQSITGVEFAGSDQLPVYCPLAKSVLRHQLNLLTRKRELKRVSIAINGNILQDNLPIKSMWRKCHALQLLTHEAWILGAAVDNRGSILNTIKWFIYWFLVKEIKVYRQGLAESKWRNPPIHVHHLSPEKGYWLSLLWFSSRCLRRGVYGAYLESIDWSTVQHLYMEAKLGRLALVARFIPCVDYVHELEGFVIYPQHYRYYHSHSSQEEINDGYSTGNR